MRRYIIVRALQAVLSLFLLSIIIFVVVRLTGDPLTLLLSEEATEEDRAALEVALGLDKPMPVQYLIFARNFLQADFGNSIRGGTPVEDLITSRIMPSVKLAAAALVIVLAVAVPLGVIAAVNKGTITDTVARFIAVFGQSVPAFWMGIILIQIFAVRLDLLPTSGMGGTAALHSSRDNTVAFRHCRRHALAPVQYAGDAGHRVHQSGSRQGCP